MVDLPNMKERLVRDALDSYKEEYRELCENWRGLESKAQSTITICGIFLAGMLAFVRGLSSTSSTAETWILIIAAVWLTAATLSSLGVVRLRSVSAAPSGDDLDGLIDDLLDAEDGDTPERFIAYTRDHAHLWSDVNRDLERVNKIKAKWLFAAHALLISGVIFAAVATIVHAGGYLKWTSQ